MFLSKIVVYQPVLLQSFFRLKDFIKRLFIEIQVLKAIKGTKNLKKVLLILGKLEAKYPTIKRDSQTSKQKNGFWVQKSNTNKFYFSKYYKSVNLITDTVLINITDTNTRVSITDVKGNTILTYSSGYVNLKNQQKKAQPKAIIRKLKLLLEESAFLKNLPVAIHFKNTTHTKQSLVIKHLKHLFFIKAVRSYNRNPHNGCRPKKLNKFKYLKIEGMTEWLKESDCKSARASFRRFESYFLQPIENRV